jgi:very-short-patch-repair endonuclease
MTLHFNQTEHKERRRIARAAMPRAEVMLWSKLKGRQLLGCKFRRQFGVESYQLDFYSAELLLAIELDGETHYCFVNTKSSGATASARRKSAV